MLPLAVVRGSCRLTHGVGLPPAPTSLAPSRHHCRALQVSDVRSIQEHLGVRHEEFRNLE